jgi:hypothetical protein
MKPSFTFTTQGPDFVTKSTPGLDEEIGEISANSRFALVSLWGQLNPLQFREFLACSEHNCLKQVGMLYLNSRCFQLTVPVLVKKI